MTTNEIFGLAARHNCKVIIDAYDNGAAFTIIGQRRNRKVVEYLIEAARPICYFDSYKHKRFSFKESKVNYHYGKVERGKNVPVKGWRA